MTEVFSTCLILPKKFHIIKAVRGERDILKGILTKLHPSCTEFLFFWALTLLNCALHSSLPATRHSSNFPNVITVMLILSHCSSMLRAVLLLSSASSSTRRSSLASSASSADDDVGLRNLYIQREEGDRILRGHNFFAILLLIRFWPYPDKSLIDSLLSTRRVSVLATLLVLAGVGNRQSVAEFSIEQMLDRLQSSFSAPSPTWQPAFGPYQTADQTPDDLAAIISRQSWQQFHAITFEDLVQYTLGHCAASVEDFVHYHTRVLPSVVSMYLRMYPAQLQRYLLATRVSSTFHFLNPAANFNDRR